MSRSRNRSTELWASLLPALGITLALTAGALPAAPPLGLPELPIPADNPQTPEKIALGEKLFNDKRFSATGDIGYVSCHAPEKAFTDSPKPVSEGVRALTGTRDAPTVVNAGYPDKPILGRPRVKHIAAIRA
jgi:cytochrome c peroxidase